MSEPIKVTRAQWDTAMEKCGSADCVHAILGPRPAPDTPPVLYDDEGGELAYVREEDGEIVLLDGRIHRLLLPWVEDHLLPWLRAMTKEDR